MLSAAELMALILATDRCHFDMCSDSLASVLGAGRWEEARPRASPCPKMCSGDNEVSSQNSLFSFIMATRYTKYCTVAVVLKVVSREELDFVVDLNTS